MKVFVGILLGLALGAGGFWLFTELRKEGRKEELSRQVATAATEAKQGLNEQLKVLDLRSEDIKEELGRTGQVVRRKAKEAGKLVADATLDARITAAIKAKLLTSKELSAWNISVNTTAGVVTLSGIVDSPDEIGRAMVIAMDAEGVREVISTLQVKKSSTGPGIVSTNVPPQPR